jgi:xanthine dehydrogenase accessory factor
MAVILGYDVSVIDPRRAFATPQRFSGLRVLDTWPDDGLAGEHLDARSAVVTLTHDPKLDDPALEAALASDAFYIGCLGSRRTHDKRLQRLRAAGFDEQSLARLHGPVGLEIGASSPAEIATAILAEITRSLRRGPSA